MKKRDIYEGVIEGIDFSDKGWLYVEERKVTMKYALPGQRVRFRIGKMKKGKAEAILLEVLELSPLENGQEACSHAGVCGGCLYQTLPYEEQLRIKEEQVRSLLRPVMEKYGEADVCGGTDDSERADACEGTAVYEGITPSPQFREYRNKMEFSFGDTMKDGPLALGMHRRGSFYDIVTVADCKIVHEDFRKILRATLDFFTRKGLPFYRKMQHTGYLRHLLVRKAVKTGQILVCLVTSSQYPRDNARFGGLSGVKENRGADKNHGVGENLENRNRLGGECGQESGNDFEMREIPEAENNFETGSDLESGDAAENVSGMRIEKGIRSETEMLSEFVNELLSAGCQGTITGVLHIVNDSLADVVQSDRTDILYGQDYFYEELLGLRFKITPFSFFQTNSLGAEALYSAVREYVGMASERERKEGFEGAAKAEEIRTDKETVNAEKIRNDRETRKAEEIRKDKGTEKARDTAPVVFDLYSGTGTIAQLLASAAGQVIGVEIVEEAVQAARENAALNGLANCTFIAADVLKALDEIPQRPDFIVLDPPREGVHPKALKKIVEYGVERMIYISCKPTSLARDLDVLMAAGYRVEKWRMVDMFPGTGNVETVVLLNRIK